MGVNEDRSKKQTNENTTNRRGRRKKEEINKGSGG